MVPVSAPHLRQPIFELNVELTCGIVEIVVKLTLMLHNDQCKYFIFCVSDSNNEGVYNNFRFVKLSKAFSSLFAIFVRLIFYVALYLTLIVVIMMYTCSGMPLVLDSFGALFSKINLDKFRYNDV